MKKMIFSVCIILFLASMVFVSYGEMQKIAISESNLADLKGKWTGTRSPRPGTALNTDLEILNDSFPVQGKLIMYDAGRKGGKSDSTQVIEFKGGKINDKGDLSFTGGPFELELSLYKDGDKLKLEGNFDSPGGRGTTSFKKK